MGKKVSLSAPWVTYWHEMNALFGEDPEIRMEYDEDDVCIKMFVESEEKAEALSQLLPEEIEFGSVILTTKIIPANTKPDKTALIERALKGNPYFDGVIRLPSEIMGNPISYVMFQKVVAQYYNDNLADPHGNISTLYQDLAKKIFGETEGMFFCTSPE